MISLFYDVDVEGNLLLVILLIKMKKRCRIKLYRFCYYYHHYFFYRATSDCHTTLTRLQCYLLSSVALLKIIMCEGGLSLVCLSVLCLFFSITYKYMIENEEF